MKTHNNSFSDATKTSRDQLETQSISRVAEKAKTKYQKR